VELALHGKNTGFRAEQTCEKRAQSAISTLDVFQNSVEFLPVNDTSHIRDGLNESELQFRATPINPQQRKKMAKTSTAKKATKKAPAKAKAKKPAKSAKKAAK